MYYLRKLTNEKSPEKENISEEILSDMPLTIQVLKDVGVNPVIVSLLVLLTLHTYRNFVNVNGVKIFISFLVF